MGLKKGEESPPGTGAGVWNPVQYKKIWPTSDVRKFRDNKRIEKGIRIT